MAIVVFFFFSSRRRHTRFDCDWSSDVCSSDLNFYGDFADLDAAHLGDVQAFFKTYYVPNNAVLLLLGDVRPGEGMALAEKHFSSIPAGPAPAFADPSEPEQNEERRGNVREQFGTQIGRAHV